MTVQLLTLLTNAERHNAQRYRWTDGQTDDIMMPIADQYDQLKASIQRAICSLMCEMLSFIISLYKW